MHPVNSNIYSGFLSTWRDWSKILQIYLDSWKNYAESLKPPIMFLESENEKSEQLYKSPKPKLDRYKDDPGIDVKTPQSNLIKTFICDCIIASHPKHIKKRKISKV